MSPGPLFAESLAAEPSTSGSLSSQPAAAPAETAPWARARDLSVVIPVHNEAGALASLLREITATFEEEADSGADYEILVVDDASTDATAEALAEASRELPRLRVLQHRQRSGQSSALLTGVRAARAPWIATLDGDGQNDPRDLPRLWRHHLEAPELAMVCGIREERKDSFVKKMASQVANGVRRRILKDGVGDTGCGVKLFRRELYLSLPAFDHMHRFLPALALAQGASLATLPVGHRPRTSGRSKYGVLDRFFVGLVDLVGVWWLRRRRLAPEGEEAPGPDRR